MSVRGGESTAIAISLSPQWAGETIDIKEAGERGIEARFY